MAIRAHADVTIRYTPNDDEYQSLETFGVEAPALERWDGSPLDPATIERLVRDAFQRALRRFTTALEHHQWEEIPLVDPSADIGYQRRLNALIRVIERHPDRDKILAEYVLEEGSTNDA